MARTIKLPKHIESTSVFYTLYGTRRRSTLIRTWDNDIPFSHTLVSIGMNPSSSDDTCSDPTVHKEMQWAADNQYNQFVKFNVCDVITPYSKDLNTIEKPCSNKNVNTIKQFLTENNKCKVVLAWGKLPAKLQHLPEHLLDKLYPIRSTLYCYEQNQDRSPSHPLYLAIKNRPLFVFRR